MFAFWLLVILIHVSEEKLFLSTFKNNDFITNDVPTPGYGFYYSYLRYLESCHENRSDIDVKYKCDLELQVSRDAVNHTLIDGFAFVPNDYEFYKANVLVQMVNKGKIATIVNGTIQKKCDKNAMAVIRTILKTNSDCLVPKGNYSINSYRPNEWHHKTMGKKTMYTRIVTKIEYYTENGIVFCIQSVNDFIPILKVKKKN